MYTLFSSLHGPRPLRATSHCTMHLTLRKTTSPHLTHTCTPTSFSFFATLKFRKAKVPLSGRNCNKCRNQRACIGECDSDKQCKNYNKKRGLKCFQRGTKTRHGYTAVPGCSGKGRKNWDYCYDPCNTCKSGGTGGGVKSPGGQCRAWCSKTGYCGTGSAYKTTGSTDCR